MKWLYLIEMNKKRKIKKKNLLKKRNIQNECKSYKISIKLCKKKTFGTNGKSKKSKARKR